MVDLSQKQLPLKQENERLQARIESLQKDITLFRISLKNGQTKITARMEEAQLNLTIDDASKTPLLDIDFSSKLGIESVESVTIEEVQEIINDRKNKLRKLRTKEEEFNKNASLIPDNDPDVVLINDKIVQVKEEVERMSSERTSVQNELKDVLEKRVHVFLSFFDKVAAVLPEIYQKLTRSPDRENQAQAGKVSLIVEDRANPFEKSLHYFPQPPTKTHVYDISQLSGGEKTVAALAMMFALI